MELFYTFIISFIIVFLSELGDKTQLLVLSFSSKNKTTNILLGVALGTFFSHGIAILFGSNISSLVSDDFNYYLKLLTYISFLLFGIIGFIPKGTSENSASSSHKFSFIQKLSAIKINYIFIVAFCIFVGELGDKTFLASLGLGLQYPQCKIPLILGSICGMVGSNSIAIFFGKLLGNRFNDNFITLLSNLIFIVFGLIGFISLSYC